MEVMYFVHYVIFDCNLMQVALLLISFYDAIVPISLFNVACHMN